MQNITFSSTRLFRSTLTCGIGLLLAASSLSVSASDLTLNQSQRAAMGMETELARPVKLIPSAIFPAQATLPIQTIRVLSSPLPGQIVKLNYVHGLISKGEVIAEIESPELLQMQQVYLANLSDLDTSQQDLERARKLNKSGISSTKKLQQARAQVKKLTLKKAQLERNLLLYGMAETAIQKLQKTHKLQPANLRIIAPIDGQLFDLKARLGERVEQNQTIISLGETDPMILRVRVPVAMANRIKAGQAVQILDSNKSGVVKHIDMMVDPMTQSVSVHIQVQNPHNELRSGQLFKLRFLSESPDNAFQVSANAISMRNGKSVVFVSEGERILTLPVQTINITDKQLYFVAQGSHPEPLIVYIKGATAIKAALDAAADNTAEQEN